MVTPVSLIGFGEAARAFACSTDFAAAAQAFDVKTFDPSEGGGSILICNSLARALAGSALVLSLVTADQAVAAARSAAEDLPAGALYCDMNSVAPETKVEAREFIDAAGGHYCDVAIMAPVHPKRLSVPLLISGPQAQDAEAALAAIGFANITIVGDAVGRASTIKMLRSVMYKGIEALTAECLLACAQAGVIDEVFGTFGADAKEQADYRLDRMLVHGSRRAAEMAEAAKTLDALGIEPSMTLGTISRQAAMGALDIKEPPAGLAAKIEALSS